MSSRHFRYSDSIGAMLTSLESLFQWLTTVSVTPLIVNGEKQKNYIFYFYYLFCLTSTLTWLITASHPYQQDNHQNHLKREKLKKGTNPIFFSLEVQQLPSEQVKIGKMTFIPYVHLLTFTLECNLRMFHPKLS